MRRASGKLAQLNRTTSTRSVYTKPLSSIARSPSADDLSGRQRNGTEPSMAHLSPEARIMSMLVKPTPTSPVGPSPRAPSLRAPNKEEHSPLSTSHPQTIEQLAHAEINEYARKRNITLFVPKTSDDRDCFNRCMHCGVITKCIAQASLMVFPDEDYESCPYITCCMCEIAAAVARVKELVDYMAVPLRSTYLDTTVVKTDHGLAHICNICWLQREEQYVVDLKSQDCVFMRSLPELKTMNPNLLEVLRKIVFWPAHYPACLREHFTKEVERWLGRL